MDPKDPSIEYAWFAVGVLDHDEARDVYMVQKVNSKGRVVDRAGEPVVNGGKLASGASVSQTVLSGFWFKEQCKKTRSGLCDPSERWENRPPRCKALRSLLLIPFYKGSHSLLQGFLYCSY